MEFKLNDYHRNIPDDELIDDIKRVANKLQKDSLSKKEYDEFGIYHSSTIEHRFNGWNKALEKAELKPTKVCKKNINNVYATPDQLLQDLKNVANKLNKRSITTTEYNRYGKHGKNFVSSRFGTWENALIQAGLEPTGYHRNIPEQKLLEEIERIWIKLGRQPTTTDIQKGISKYSLKAYSNKFGGWRGALEAFVEWINEKPDESNVLENNTKNESFSQTEKSSKCVNNISINHKTNRGINLRLRFKVMQRDNFKCVICGTSPAKDPSVELHIDHIIPWSKGGETIIDNLQTLCSKCNLGKSDLI